MYSTLSAASYECSGVRVKRIYYREKDFEWLREKLNAFSIIQRSSFPRIIYIS